MNIQSHFDFKMFHKILDRKVFFEKTFSKCEDEVGGGNYSPILFHNKLGEAIKL